MVIAVFLTLQPDQTLFGDAESPRKSVRLGSRLAVMSCTQMPSQFIALSFLLWTQRASKQVCSLLFSPLLADVERRRRGIHASFDRRRPRSISSIDWVGS